MTYINNSEGLVGDFLGTIPAMQALAKKDKLVVQVHPEAKKLLPLIHNPDGIIWTDIATGEISHTLSSSKAFELSLPKQLYMSQAFFLQLGLPVPENAPKALLGWNSGSVEVCDYVLSPFARSLPNEQKWPQEKWQELVDTMSDKSFIVLGNSKYDDPNFLTGENVKAIFDRPFTEVGDTLKVAREGLISVVTGTSHLAFHLGVHNWVLNNQDFRWGTNPSGHHIRTPIPKLLVPELINFLGSNR